MTGADLRRLLLLAALWGGSFLFIRVAVAALGPFATATGRAGFAALALLLITAAARKPLDTRTWWRQYAVLGLINSALPFALIAFAETRLSASVAAILNATGPLFAAVIAAFWLRDPLTSGKIVGILIAITGVAVLVGWGPLTLNGVTLLAMGASLAAAFSYGLASVYTKAKGQGIPPLGMATGSQIAASLFLLPALPFTLPAVALAPPALFCLLALAVFSTACAFLLYFRLIADVGPTRALSVTFLTPIFGMVWAALFLGEPVTLSKLAACAIILLGTAFVTGIDLRPLTGRLFLARQRGYDAGTPGRD